MDKMAQYLLLAKSARGRALAEIIMKATAEPSVFAFGELWDLPNVQELANGDFAGYYHLLNIFTYGTLADFKGQSNLPAVSPEQQMKLKQLTMLTLASNEKTLSYNVMMAQIDLPNVRELENFIITQCFYPNILKGKLDQRKSCLLVYSMIGRDVKFENVGALASSLTNWLRSSQGVLSEIESMVSHTATHSETLKKHKEEMEAKLEEVKKTTKFDLDRGPEVLMDDSYDYMEEERPRDRDRPKSRRR